jgi:hypothetical protein
MNSCLPTGRHSGRSVPSLAFITLGIEIENGTQIGQMVMIIYDHILTNLNHHNNLRSFSSLHTFGG